VGIEFGSSNYQTIALISAILPLNRRINLRINRKENGRKKKERGKKKEEEFAKLE